MRKNNKIPVASKKQTEQNLTAIQTTSSTSVTVRPIPSPEDLQKYNEIDPNLVNRIIGMAEKEQQFRHEITKITVNSLTNSNRYGQVFAFLLALGCLTASGFLAYFGAYFAAITIGGTTTLGVIYQMLTGTRKVKAVESQEK